MQKPLGVIGDAQILGQLRETERRLASFLQGCPLAYMEFDTQMRVVEWNPAATAIFGFQRSEAIGRSIDELILPADSRDAVTDELDLGDARPLETARTTVVNVTKFGARVSCEWHRTILKDSGGQVIGLAILARDITERKRAEAALKEAQLRVEAASQAKSEFLSRMSHELRTPLNAILGFAQLLELDAPSVRQRSFLEQILKGGVHLLHLINEVLDLARIEAGRMELAVEPVAVRKLFQDVLEMMWSLAEPRRISLRVHPPVAEEVHVLGDAQSLRQVLLNLLSNGVKYNVDGGSVTLSCQESGSGRLRLSVHDTGKGIPADKRDRLFTPFDRLGAETTPVEGSGLGLVLSKRLTEAMGGTLDLESIPGEGTLFWVELSKVSTREEPSRPPQSPNPQAGAEAVRRKYTVLYIEDNPTNLALVEGILAYRPEITMLSALQGETGLDMARQHRPNVILLDVHLPDIQGDEVLRRLKAAPDVRDIPVVVISADATPHQIEKLRTAGALEYLTKPLDVARFSHIMDRLVPPVGGTGQ